MISRRALFCLGAGVGAPVFAPMVGMDFGKQPALVVRDAAGYFREIDVDIKFENFEPTRA